MPVNPDDYTKDELQELAADRDLPVSGTKDELADAINAHDQDADDQADARGNPGPGPLPHAAPDDDGPGFRGTVADGAGDEHTMAAKAAAAAEAEAEDDQEG